MYPYGPPEYSRRDTVENHINKKKQTKNHINWKQRTRPVKQRTHRKKQ